jgi:hypothetical protein
MALRTPEQHQRPVSAPKPVEVIEGRWKGQNAYGGNKFLSSQVTSRRLSRILLSSVLACMCVASWGCSASRTRVQSIPRSASLSWNPSTSPVVGYNVYRGTQSGGPYFKLNSSPQRTTSFTDSTVQSGATYFYIVTSMNANSVESAYSDEAKAVIPVP